MLAAVLLVLRGHGRPGAAPAARPPRARRAGRRGHGRPGRPPRRPASAGRALSRRARRGARARATRWAGTSTRSPRPTSRSGPRSCPRRAAGTTSPRRRCPRATRSAWSAGGRWPARRCGSSSCPGRASSRATGSGSTCAGPTRAATATQRRGWQHESAQADFHGLRPFRPGDSPRLIHWRSLGPARRTAHPRVRGRAGRGPLRRRRSGLPGRRVRGGRRPRGGPRPCLVPAARRPPRVRAGRHGPRRADRPRTRPRLARSAGAGDARASPTRPPRSALAAGVGGQMAALVVSHGGERLAGLCSSANWGGPSPTWTSSRYREWGFYTPP